MKNTALQQETPLKIQMKFFNIQDSVEKMLLQTQVEHLEHDELFVASIPNVKGCFGQGKTEAEALTNFREVLSEWILFRLEQGLSIPIFL